MPRGEPPTEADLAAVSAQLGRPVRDVLSVASRCSCGLPDVVTTAPRLRDGTPFPTFFYLTCPRLTAAISTLESEGLMAEIQQRLSDEPETARRYREAHRRYLQERAEHGEVPEIDGVSAGGMPDRVKCLHVLAGQSLAMGPDVNPFGDEVLAELHRRDLLRRPVSCVAAQ